MRVLSQKISFSSGCGSAGGSNGGLDSRETVPARKSQEERLACRERFLSRIPDSPWSRELSSRLQSSEYSVRDLEGLYVCVSKGVASRLGFDDPEQLVGLPESDHLPEQLARISREEDALVLRDGRPFGERFGLVWVGNPGLVWVGRTKFPVWDGQGAPLGIVTIETQTAARGSEGQLVPPRGLHDVRIGLAIAALAEGYDAALSNAELARRSGLSERQLSRLFSSVFGFPPNRFGTELRIRLSCEVLVGSDDSIRSIACRFGFSDQSSYSNRFRCVVGTTPAAFRRRWRR